MNKFNKSLIISLWINAQQYFSYNYIVVVHHYSKMVSTEIKECIISLSLKFLQWIYIAILSKLLYSYTIFSIVILSSLQLYNLLYSYTIFSIVILSSIYLYNLLYSYTIFSIVILSFLQLYYLLYSYTIFSIATNLSSLLFQYNIWCIKKC